MWIGAEWTTSLIDILPPSTGDIHLTIVQTVPVTGVIVDLPHRKPVPLADAKGIAMFSQAQLNTRDSGWWKRRLLHRQTADNKYLFGKTAVKTCFRFSISLPRADTHCAEHPRGGDIGRCRTW